MMKSISSVAIALLLARVVAAQDTPLSQILIEGEGWKKVEHPFLLPFGLTADRQGNVYVADERAKEIYRIDHDGKVTTFSREKAVYRNLAFGPGGKLYASQTDKRRLVALDAEGRETVVADKITVDGLAVTKAGDCYVAASDMDGGSVQLFRHDGSRQSVAKELGLLNGLVLWPDQGTLVAGKSDFLYAFRVQKDGMLTDRDSYYGLRPHPTEHPVIWGLTIDEKGRVYAVSRIGVQFFDSTGRFSGLLLPPERQICVSATFGGPERDLLYVACASDVYYRKLKAKGVAWAEKK
jgi:sugar lactone lactonase YvrE